MDIAVGIINWNSGHWLKDCIASLGTTAGVAEIVIVDNASTDDSLDSAKGSADRIQIVRNSSNLGFAGGVNQVFASTTAPFVLILNPDIGVVDGAVEQMRQFLAVNPKAAAVGGNIGDNYLPRLLPTVSSLIRENLGFPRRIKKTQADEPYEVEQPAAAALLVRRLAYLQVGGFDTRFYPAWYEDVDFCKQLKAAGWQVYFDPTARFLHEGGYSAKALGTTGFAVAYYRNQLRYARKHMSAAAGIAVRCSIAVGMAARAIAAPANAGAFFTVLGGALGKW